MFDYETLRLLWWLLLGVLLAAMTAVAQPANQAAEAAPSPLALAWLSRVTKRRTVLFVISDFLLDDVKRTARLVVTNDAGERHLHAAGGDAADVEDGGHLTRGAREALAAQLGQVLAGRDPEQERQRHEPPVGVLHRVPEVGPRHRVAEVVEREHLGDAHALDIHPAPAADLALGISDARVYGHDVPEARSPKLNARIDGGKLEATVSAADLWSLTASGDLAAVNAGARRSVVIRRGCVTRRRVSRTAGEKRGTQRET